MAADQDGGHRLLQKRREEKKKLSLLTEREAAVLSQHRQHRLLPKSQFVGKDELSHELIISSPAYKFRGCQRQRRQNEVWQDVVQRGLP